MGSSPPTRAPALLAALACLACGGAAEAPSQARGEDDHVGRIAYEPIEPVKSIHSYMGDEFRLVARGTSLVLTPTDAVPRDALIAAAGKTVSLRCTLRAPVAPSPMEQFPMGPDGRPLARPATCAVYEIRDAAGE